MDPTREVVRGVQIEPLELRPTPGGVPFIEWPVALLIGPVVEGERQALELATVELMQRHWLDARLEADGRAAGEGGYP